MLNGAKSEGGSAVRMSGALPAAFSSHCTAVGQPCHGPVFRDVDRLEERTLSDESTPKLVENVRIGQWRAGGVEDQPIGLVSSSSELP
jgi:hypothetical protein